MPLKMFKCVTTQTLTNGVWVDDPVDGAATLEEQVNTWLDLTGAKLEALNTSIVRHTEGAKAVWTVYGAAVYACAEKAEPLVEQTEAKLPLMYANVQTQSGPQRVKVYPGVFGVIPGTKFGQEDESPPPAPLLATDGWRKHEGLFV